MRCKWSIMWALCGLACVAFGQPGFAQVISTVAGGGVGDGLLAIHAALNGPSAVCADGSGTFYVVDRRHHRVRRVDAFGAITTVAGNGLPGFAGDGGAAVDASLNGPSDIWMGGDGDLYIVDTGNHRVRRVDAFGVITTVAGNGEGGFWGDGGAANEASLNGPTGLSGDGAGNLYIADRGNHRVRRVDVFGVITTVAGGGEVALSADGGPATAAVLAFPGDVAVNSAGHLYISDEGNRRIWRVDDSGMMTTFFGGEVLSGPAGLFVGAGGSLYVADRGNHRVLRIDSEGRATTLVGGGIRAFGGDGGPATGAYLAYPSDVFVDGSGNLYIADLGNVRVRRVNASGLIETVAGGGVGDGGPATGALLSNPFGVFADGSGNLYIADTSNQRIRKVDPFGTVTTVAGNGQYGFSGDGGWAIDARLADPIGVCVDGAGNVYVADTFNQRIRRVDASGVITTVVGDGMKGFSGDGGAATAARLADPTGIFVDAAGALYIADKSNHRVRRVDASGSITTVAGDGVKGFSGDGGAATAAHLADPFGLFVDGAGNLYIADRSNYRIRKVDPSGTISTVAGEGSGGYSGDGGVATQARLRVPSGVFVDLVGDLYIADRGNSRIRRVDALGTITTVVGDGNRGFAGDGEAAVRSGLDSPFGLFIDGAGALYIADTENQRVRQVRPPRRSIRIWTDTGSIAADGASGSTIQVEVLDLEGGDAGGDPGVGFRVLEGDGTLSKTGVVAAGGKASTDLTSRRPGTVIVQALADGAWGVTASVEVTPVLELGVSTDLDTISANGFDMAVVQVALRDLDGALQRGDDSTQVRFRIVKGAGELSVAETAAVEGRASADLTSRRPGTVIVQAFADGAWAVNAPVRVLRPTPGQIPDEYEPDNGMAGAKAISIDGAVQARTMHTRDEVDWVSFEARPGYGYSVLTSGELDVYIDAYVNGEALGRYKNRAEFKFWEAQGATVFLALSGEADRRGRYEISIFSVRDAVLSMSADQAVIAADGSDASLVQVQILDSEGRLLAGDDSSRVVFEVTEGDGLLSPEEVTVAGGTATTRLTSRSPGRVTVEASVADVQEEVVVTVGATPALALDLDLNPGDQMQRETAVIPAVGDAVEVDLVALSGARGIVGLHAKLTYDPNQLGFVAFGVTDLMASGMTILSFPNEGEVEINVAILGGGTTGKDGGSVGHATFRALEGIRGEARVALVSGTYGRLGSRQSLKIGSKRGSVSVGASTLESRGAGTATLADFKAAFGTREGESDYDLRLDLDGDGTVGFADFVLFLQNSAEALKPDR